MIKRIIFLLLMIAGQVASPAIQANDATYSVSGSIQHPGKGRIYVFLVDREGFKQPLTGLKIVVLDVTETGVSNFSFTGVPEGVYGIRCYQDINGNRKLDGGLFGPKEPWGMSWNAQRPLRWPRFDHISFRVGVETPELNIQLK